MRKKSITLLVCVYAALCISYTVVSSAMVPHSEEIWQTASQVSTDPSSQSSSSDTSSPTVKEKASVSENSDTVSQAHTSSEENDMDDGVAETADSSEGENNSDAAQSGSEEVIGSANDDQEQDAYSGIVVNEIPEQVTEAYDSGEESQEQINDEDEYQEAKPSLTDYLSGLRCSGCRHNCSLLSPRCMNGARKASQAESEYYQTYGA